MASKPAPLTTTPVSCWRIEATRRPVTTCNLRASARGRLCMPPASEVLTPRRQPKPLAISISAAEDDSGVRK
ncbi:hypothetical protein [Cupriavidus basilensis]|uniref:hypothetical protein n=1 Tax=Cupriavidus basilensis TaxID=68895 RepID=UPI00157A9BD1|nr:hypothetical protein [Cupriavidus basilensis]